MDKVILFAIFALAFLIGAIMRVISGLWLHALILFFFAALCAWFSLASARRRPR